MQNDRKAQALTYLESVAKKDFSRVESLLAPDLRFQGPISTRTSAGDYVSALKRLASIHVGNEVRHVFVDGDEVCVIYDFVTDTSAGALPVIEWLHFAEGRIQAIDLFYDRLPWQTVTAVMTERAARQVA